MILGVDPGDKTGYAILFMDGRALQWGQFTAEEFIEWLAKRDWSDIERIVIEDFILFKKKAQQQTGSRFKTVQVIGALKMIAAQHDIPITMQGSEIKTIAQRWSKVHPPAQHDKSHKYDAYNHAFYWLVKNRYAKTAWERQASGG